MMVLSVRKSDGAVLGRRSWRREGLPPPDADRFWIEQPAEYDPSKEYKVDADGNLFESPSVTLFDLKAVRAVELAASDWRAVSDRVIEPEWSAYRQALRDITGGGKDVVSMLAAFPKRPDGSDPVAHLRQGNG